MIQRTRLQRHTPMRRTPGRPSAAEKRCRELLPVRSDGRCEITIRRVCTGWGQVCSHRKRRSQSSKAEKWSLTNCLHGCQACERYLTDFGATDHVRSQGWTVHPSVDPAAMPVWYRGTAYTWLREDGSVEPLDLLEVATWIGAI